MLHPDLGREGVSDPTTASGGARTAELRTLTTSLNKLTWDIIWGAIIAKKKLSKLP
jgi:hypothetical protein